MPHPPLPGEQPPGEHAEELLAILAHELRQPLTALRGALLTLQHRTQPLSGAQQQELLEMANRQGEQLQRLLDQLLTAASTDHVPALSARRSLVDVAALAEEAGHTARLAHPHHPITIEAAGPLLVRVDPLAISRILGNLLDNAAAYSPQGAAIRLTARRAGGHALVAVQDQGPGIPLADRERIFQRHVRLHPPSATAVGLGLGSTSPGGWPPRTAVSSSLPIRQALEVPGLSCACPWQRGRRGVAAPAGRLRSDRATSAAVVGLGHLEPNRSEARNGAGRPATVLTLASQYRQ
jgi:His Kinase A (phospho-acceptor) domain/Histidine kinase-, DNA gyrase B-, and HSP90-like ATPase